MTLPTEATGREEWPIYDYQYNYFPDAYLEEVRVSWIGNQQHNPGQRMHWAREKSSDHMNKAMRHLDDYGRGIKKDTDGTYHLAKVIWRLKARLQLDIEEERTAKLYVQNETARAQEAMNGQMVTVRYGCTDAQTGRILTLAECQDRMTRQSFVNSCGVSRDKYT